MKDVTRLPMKPGARKFWGTLLLVLWAGFALGWIGLEIVEHAAKYEAFSRKWFKAVGAPLGMLTILLLVTQYLIAAKYKWLDRIYGLDTMFRAHRVVGTAAVFTALSHPLIMFAPRLEKVPGYVLSSWVLAVGAVILVSLAVAVPVALFRERLGLKFSLWLPMHRGAVLFLGLLAIVHSTFVEEHPHLHLIQYLLIGGLAAYAWGFLVRRGQVFRVAGLEDVGRDSRAVMLSPQGGEVFGYAPGQFAFVTFHSRNLPKEEHPWTINSSPTRGEGLIFTIKKSGDFTAEIDKLARGDLARVSGPYGLFSHTALELSPSDELVMVAGGVGITPLLSMLRCMADTGDKRKLTLIWSNRSEEDILWRGEIEELAGRLNLDVHHVLTRQQDWDGFSGRIDPAMLEKMLGGVSRSAQVMLCGPPAMMDAVSDSLRRSGFSASRIHTERFSL